MSMYILDSTVIITIAKAAGAAGLNLLTNNGNTVTITDSVQREILIGNSPDVADIKSWLSGSSSSIITVTTQTEDAYISGLIKSSKDVGDASITELLYKIKIA